MPGQTPRVFDTDAAEDERPALDEAVRVVAAADPEGAHHQIPNAPSGW
jgi:hypothetical protein